MPSVHRSVRIALSLVLISALVLMAGCRKKGPTWVDEGNGYTLDAVTGAFDRADASAISGRSSSDAIDLRHDMLTSLRNRGGEAATAADLITKTFPANTRGVPVYVERATVSGKPAYLIVEATGRDDGKLTDKRLWVIDSSGTILFSGMRR